VYTRLWSAGMAPQTLHGTNEAEYAANFPAHHLSLYGSQCGSSRLGIKGRQGLFQVPDNSRSVSRSLYSVSRSLYSVSRSLYSVSRC